MDSISILLLICLSLIINYYFYAFDFTVSNGGKSILLNHNGISVSIIIRSAFPVMLLAIFLSGKGLTESIKVYLAILFLMSHMGVPSAPLYENLPKTLIFPIAWAAYKSDAWIKNIVIVLIISGFTWVLSFFDFSWSLSDFIYGNLLFIENASVYFKLPSTFIALAFFIISWKALISSGAQNNLIFKPYSIPAFLFNLVSGGVVLVYLINVSTLFPQRVDEWGGPFKTFMGYLLFHLWLDYVVYKHETRTNNDED